MQRGWLIAFMVGSLAATTFAAEEPQDRLEQLEEEAFQQAVALVGPSVVRIETVGGLAQIGPGVTAAGTTSGLVLSEDGYIVSSAFHFASKPTSILATLADGRRFPVKLIATDRLRMVVLLKIDATGLQTCQAAPANEFRVGQWSIALGRTFDAEVPSVSVGIVSAVNRIWGKAVQTDAKISPVNYGGPLVDIRGRVMGILVPLSPQSNGETAGVEWYDSGIGFAVPLEDILAVADRLKSGTDLLPGVLGITFLGRDAVGTEPVLDRVRYGSPAELAGLKKGDRLVSADGKPLKYVAELRSILGRRYAGDTITVTYDRDKQSTEVKLTLVDQIPPYEPAFLGVSLLRQTEEGAPTVRIVWPDSPAAMAGVQPRDQLQKWNEEALTSGKQLAERVSRMRPGETAQLTVSRGGKTVTLTVKVTIPPDAVPANYSAEALSSDGAALAEAKVGRVQATLAGHDRPYWMYVPESTREKRPQSLLLFLHPGGDTVEASLLSAWKSECERRGIIILAPKTENVAGWTPTDLEFVQDCLAKVQEDYTIAPDRIIVHAVGNAVPFAGLVAFRNRTAVRGVAVLGGALRGQPPENDPDERLQFYFGVSATDGQVKAIETFVTALRKAKYPVVFTKYAETAGASYPEGQVIEELARWVDGIDAI